MSNLNEFLSAFLSYRTGRLKFLAQIGCAESNRDPLAEASEYLVALLTGGELVKNRVQKGYDVVGSDGKRIQVKYLANPLNENKNGHTIQFPNEADLYAVVVFENLLPRSVLVFTRESVGPVYDRLGKRHKGRGYRLELTKANTETIALNAQEFRAMGIAVYPLMPGLQE